MEEKIKNIESFDLQQGTIAFWVKASEFDWNNNEQAVLVDIAQEEQGRIKIIKNDKNVLEAIYQKGPQQNEASVDVSGLSEHEKHHIAFSWSQADQEINLYLDGNEVDQEKIN